MIHFKKLLALLAILALTPLPLAHAQEGGPVPHVVDTTKPVAPEVIAAVDALLAANPPSAAMDYVITYARRRGLGWRVSVAALDPLVEGWHIEDAVWWGSMELQPAAGGYEADYMSSALPGRNLAHLASPILAPGGGSYVRFPWQAGKNMQYGTRGVHGGGFGTPNMIGIDWLGGADLGANVASDMLYASDSGEIDNVCEDGTSVGIRTYNSGTGDYFVYLHMNPSASFTVGQDVTAGQALFNLQHGSFDDSCGTASQQSDHYHVHWGIVPASGHYVAEDCNLDQGTGIWDCNGDEIAPGEYMYGGGGTGTGEDDPTTASPDTGFWDFLMAGLLGAAQATIFGILPEHEDIEFLYTVSNAIIAVFAITYVLLKGSTTLYPVFWVVGSVITIELLRMLIIIVVAIVRLIKQIPFL